MKNQNVVIVANIHIHCGQVVFKILRVGRLWGGLTVHLNGQRHAGQEVKEESSSYLNILGFGIGSSGLKLSVLPLEQACRAGVFQDNAPNSSAVLLSSAVATSGYKSQKCHSHENMPRCEVLKYADIKTTHEEKCIKK